MKYLKNIGNKSRKAFEKLKNIDHRKIKSVLKDYSKNIFKNKKLILMANVKDIKKAKKNI